MYADTHAHLNHERFYQETDAAIERAGQAGVGLIVNVGFDLASSWLAVELADRHADLFAVVGLHPHDAQDCTPAMMDEVLQMSKLGKVVGIGEVGLDFHYDNSPRPVQKAVFAQFVSLAAEAHMPLVVHSREADQATLEVLDAERADDQKIVMHCFGGDPSFARACVERGFLLGIAGPVTFPNALALQKAVQSTAIESLLLETDCPYLAPQPRRGKRNEPAFIPMIAEQVAKLKGVDVGVVEEVTTSNARRFYGIQGNPPTAMADPTSG